MKQLTESQIYDNNFLFFKYCLLNIIKAKYNVIEPHYMEGTTPDGLIVFSGSSILVILSTIPLKNNL